MLDESNFNPWRLRMLSLLEEHELLECVRTSVGDVAELKEKPGKSRRKRRPG